MNQENTTSSMIEENKQEGLINENSSQEEPKSEIDLNILSNDEETEEDRKTIKINGIELIDDSLNFFKKIIEEGLTIDKLNYLNTKLYSTLLFLEINASKLVSQNNEDLSNIDGETITHEQALAIYELSLWKRINDFIEDNPTLNIFTTIYFLRDIKNYILNVCYKNHVFN